MNDPVWHDAPDYAWIHYPSWYRGFYDETFIEIVWRATAPFRAVLELGRSGILLDQPVPHPPSQPTRSRIDVTGQRLSARYGDFAYPREEIRDFAGCDPDLFDHVVLHVLGSGTVEITEVRLVLNGAQVFDLVLDWTTAPQVVGKATPLVLDEFIRHYRVNRLHLSSFAVVPRVLSVAADDYGQAISPKYGMPWGWEVDGHFGHFADAPTHGWCSEFSSFCIREGTRGYPDGPLCLPDEIFLDLMPSRAWNFGQENLDRIALGNHFQDKGRFVGPQAYYDLHNNLVPNVPYVELGNVVRPGFYFRMYPADHGALFIRWASPTGFNPNVDRNDFVGIGGAQRGLVSVAFFSVARFAGPEISIPWINENSHRPADPATRHDVGGFGDTSYQPWWRR